MLYTFESKEAVLMLKTSRQIVAEVKNLEKELTECNELTLDQTKKKINQLAITHSKASNMLEMLEREVPLEFATPWEGISTEDDLMIDEAKAKFANLSLEEFRASEELRQKNNKLRMKSVSQSMLR